MKELPTMELFLLMCETVFGCSEDCELFLQRQRSWFCQTQSFPTQFLVDLKPETVRSSNTTDVQHNETVRFMYIYFMVIEEASKYTLIKYFQDKLMSFVHPSSLIFPQEKGRHTKSRTKFLLEAYSKKERNKKFAPES